MFCPQCHAEYRKGFTACSDCSVALVAELPVTELPVTDPVSPTPESSIVQYLPPDEEQEWLIDQLRELVRARGYEAFALWPIVEPTNRFFPDPWNTVLEGADRVGRRLMQYAGLGHLDMSVEGAELPREGTCSDERHEERHVPACFLGIEHGCCRFAIDGKTLRAAALPGIMSHEVAHAYRRHFRLEVSDRDAEEILTDVTAAYLGFGLLCANSSYLYRKSGWMNGASVGTLWSSSAAGYLPVQASCFLVAVQMAARGLEADARRPLLKLLETNQSHFVKAALAEIEESGRDVASILGLPARRSWPGPRNVTENLPPLPEPNVIPEEEPLEEFQPESWNEGRPVFRVGESKAIAYAINGGLGGVLLGIMASAVIHPWLSVAVFGAAGLAAGTRLSRQTRRDLCSDSTCQAVLDPGVSKCPGCAGYIAGRIQPASDRFEMEEKLVGVPREHGAGDSEERLRQRDEQKRHEYTPGPKASLDELDK